MARTAKELRLIRPGCRLWYIDGRLVEDTRQAGANNVSSINDHFYYFFNSFLRELLRKHILTEVEMTMVILMQQQAIAND